MVETSSAGIRYSNVKWEFKLTVSQAPLLKTKQGESFSPGKIVVTSYEDRAKIVVTGRSYSSFQTRSSYFNINSYDYPPPPEWIMKLLAEVGFFPAQEVEHG